MGASIISCLAVRLHASIIDDGCISSRHEASSIEAAYASLASAMAEAVRILAIALMLHERHPLKSIIKEICDALIFRRILSSMACA